ncbi:MAG: PDC sensor domain-containing protein [Desulfomonilia bacterium]
MPELKRENRIITVARLFFLLLVIPLLLISSLIAFSIFRIGGISKIDTVSLLDKTSQQEISVRAVDLAQSIAEFLNERQKDVLIATILSPSNKTYKEFLDTKTNAVWVKKDGSIVMEHLPLYTEISLIDEKGQELIKIAQGKIVPQEDLVNVSDPTNTTYKSEDYFLQATRLNKGDVYFSPVTGWYLNKEEFKEGKRFNGIIRMATPLFDKQGFTGVVSLALDVRHLMKFTDNIIPTETDYVIESDSSTGNYAYLVDNMGFVISHPDDYHIRGLYRDGTPVPPLTSENYEEMVAKGEEVLNLNELGFLDPVLPEIAQEASLGKSGIKTYKFEGHTKILAYAPIPFSSEQYLRPGGFGWVGMGVDVDKYNEQASIASERLERESQAWLSTVILIIIVAMILLFCIAAILSRGINRSIQSEVPPEAMRPARYDDED